jgi:prolyl 4-hydroxylase
MKSLEIEELFPGNILAIKNVLTLEECKSYIELSEKKGYKPATLQLTENKNSQEIIATDIRNHDRVIIENSEISELLWNRIKDNFPNNFKIIKELVPSNDNKMSEECDFIAVGVSNYFRFYRYNVGQRFVRHFDGYEYGSMIYTKNLSNQPNVPTPKLSILIYLNEEFQGGKTTFFNSKGKEIVAVTPQTGKVLIYNYQILHEGSLVSEGLKYIMRSDILFLKQLSSINTNNSTSNNFWYCLIQ